MKLTKKNLKMVFSIINSQINDENAHGEYDSKTDILFAVKNTVDWIDGGKT